MAEPVQFSIDVVGEETGERFKGLFKTKVRLSQRDQLRQDEMRRELLGKNAEHATVRAHNQAEVLSTILTHLQDAPKWWKAHGEGLELEDDAPLRAIYDGIVKAKADYREKLNAEAEAAKKELATTPEINEK